MDRLLQETGELLLQETGDAILLDVAAVLIMLFMHHYRQMKAA